MSVLEGFKNVFIGSSEDDYDEDTYELEEMDDTNDSSDEYTNRENKIHATSSVQIVLARPSDFSEVKSIGDDLNAGKTVLLNLETVKNDDAKRILDFLSGVAYANGADIKMMAQKTFAIMPRSVGFSGVDLMSELENSGYDINEFWY